MRALRIESDRSKPRLANIPTPPTGAAEVRISVRAAGLNFADLLMQTGKYQDTPNAPFTMGLEAAGVIEDCGQSVHHLSVNDRVAVYAPHGAFAQSLTVAADRVTPIPDAMPFEHAAAFPVAYGTSHIALDHLARLRAGERLFVSGASSGVGLTAVEIGALMGAEVIAYARDAERLAIAKAAGATHLIDESTDIRAALKDLGGADVVYDTIGGDVFRAAFRATNPGGRLLPIGFAGGDVPQIPANHLLVKNLTVIGFYIGGYLKSYPDVICTSMTRLLAWYTQGHLSPHIGAAFSLEQADQAFELMRTRKATGKVILKP